MIVLNLLMVIATILVKAIRAVQRRRRKRLRESLEPALYDYLATGDISQDLRVKRRRAQTVLSDIIVELLNVLQGSQSQSVVDLAGELGLVERDLKQLDSPGLWSRAKAVENLGYYGGPESVGPMSELLSESDETIKAVAARALSRIGTREAAESLTRFLNSDSELTSLRMAENLERIGPLAVDPLIELIESEDEDGRRAQVLAAQILGNLRVAKARTALQQAIKRHWNTDIRAQSALALGKIGNPDDLPALLEAAEDNSWPVRVQAANALGMIGETETVPTLEKLVADEEWWVRLNASRALVNIGPEGERALVRTLDNPDRYARDRAAATLEEQGVVRRMAGELVGGNGRSEHARSAIRALVRVGATRYLEQLSLSLPQREERQALSQVLADAKAEVRAKTDSTNEAVEGHR